MTLRTFGEPLDIENVIFILYNFNEYILCDIIL